jgi:hypothetical protein
MIGRETVCFAYYQEVRSKERAKVAKANAPENAEKKADLAKQDEKNRQSNRDEEPGRRPKGKLGAKATETSVVEDIKMERHSMNIRQERQTISAIRMTGMLITRKFKKR